MSNFLRIFFIISLLFVSFAYADEQAEEQKPKQTDKEFACNGLHAERVELEYSLKHSVRQEFLDDKVLVEFGSLMAFMTPQQSVSYYNERIRHIKALEEILDCKSENTETQEQ